MTMFRVLMTAIVSVSSVHGFWAGVGLGDMTGPAADVNLMGYAMPAQVSGGIHFRLRARAFVFGEEDKSNKKIAFVSVDNGMGSTAVTREVVARLEKEFPGVYTLENVCISGTHTHSAPAGFLQNVLFQVTSLGFVHQAFDAYVTGIVDAIKKAHNTAKSGRKLSVARGEMKPLSASINRSPSAYANNPKWERDQYQHNVDLNMTVLRITEADGTPVGMINWFATHGTSMPNTNTLLSGDNKGYASQLFEFWMNGPEIETGKGSFVAAFASTNLGDVSPNVNGTFCTDTGKPCEELHSTCEGRNENCHGRGPSSDPVESTAIIGSRQAEFAKILFEKRASRLGGSRDSRVLLDADVEEGVDFIHAFRDFSKIQVHLPQENKTVSTCKPSMGYSFAAGTTDGPGAFNFFQSEKTTNPFWEFLRDFLKTPSKELEDCQHPKPVLLPTGEMETPYAWDPSILPLQLFRLGKQLAIISVPSEFTTMSGRRMRAAIRKLLVEGGALDAENGMVVIAGLANEYSSYVTTPEEFQIQRYEAASTLFGPHTLPAYIQEMSALAKHMIAGEKAPAGPAPPNLMDKQLQFLPDPLPDGVGSDAGFGAVEKDVEQSYDMEKDPGLVISATFHSANPRNNLRLGGTYLLVERQNDAGIWEQVASDADFDTRFIWRREGILHSKAVIEWRPGQSLRPIVSGTYRLTHFGTRKHITGSLSSFVGHSQPFKLNAGKGISMTKSQDGIAAMFFDV